MSRSQRTSLTSAVNVAAIVFAGAIVGSSAVGLAARAYASPCDPIGLAMTPQPVLSCPSPEPAPPVPGGAPAAGPVDNVAAPPAPGAPPPPGQPPYVPPVASGDGPQPLSQLGYLREIWHQFHNGVPLDLLYGPAPTDTTPPPNP